MKKAYIGVTGFMLAEEVHQALSVLPENSDRLLMVGVLASSKTLVGEKNKFPNRYPEVDVIAKIFPKSDKVLNLIHYNTKDMETLAEQMIKMTNIAGENFNGLQLNIKLPNPKVLENHKKLFPNQIFVLPISSGTFEAVGHSAEKLSEKVSEYDGLVDYILLDPSGGYGIPFDPIKAKEYLTVLQEKNSSIMLGAAGGLSPETLNLIEPLVPDFPQLCIDAEGRLREKETDQLIISRTKEYIKGALSLFEKTTV